MTALCGAVIGMLTEKLTRLSVGCATEEVPFGMNSTRAAMIVAVIAGLLFVSRLGARASPQRSTRPDNSSVGRPILRAASATDLRALTRTMPRACRQTLRSDALSPA